MYTEEPRREINWGNFIKKGLVALFILILIFLLIWSFTRKESHGVDVDYNNNNNNQNINSNLDDAKTYSEIFISNYRYLHDTAKEYFLISELPSNGKTIKYTLQELINKGLIIPFSYTNGKSCDTEASYVTVKNVDGKYTYTVTLVCGTEVATTTEELGCNQLCNGKSCDNNNTPSKDDTKKPEETVKEYEYQYKQAYKANESTYTCPSGYTKVGNSSSTKCVKSSKDVKKADVTVKYYCPEGYTHTSGSDANMVCSKGKNETTKPTEKVTYTCKTGYTLKGNECYKTTNATTNVIYSCPTGYKKNGNICTKESVDTIVANVDYTYTCPSGYTKKGTKCTKYVSGTTVSPIKSTTSYCSTGTKEGSSCVYYYYSKTYTSKNSCTYIGTVTNYCENGSCNKLRYKYKCTTGISSKNTYSCPSGSTHVSGSGANMVCKTSGGNQTISATENPNYSCPSDYELNGTNCTKTETLEESVTKSCPTGYIMNGNKCVKTTNDKISATKSVKYTCPSGSTHVSGSDANMVCKVSEASNRGPIKNTTYTCPSGYEKVGSGSDSQCVKKSSESISATKATKSVTKYKYKWSKETSLKGWTRTGKSRLVKASAK